MNAENVSRRSFIGGTLAWSAAGLAACAPAASRVPAPAGVSSPGAAGAEPWKAEWDRLLEAARKEGTLSLAAPVGTGIQKGVAAFEQAFPGVKVEVQGFASASLLIPRVDTERQAGVFSWDVAQITIQSLLTSLKPKGVFDPLRAAVIRPDVTGDQYWTGGFDASFVDKERQFAFLMSEEAGGQFWINLDLVKDDEIKTVQDLLHPKWKGKMLIQDVRAGSFTTFHAIRTNAGDEVVRKILIDQAPVFSRDPRQITDGLVRGQYAIVRGVNDSYLQDLRDKGVGKNVKAIDLPEARIVNSSGGLWLFNRVPHSNAAKLFINWILTKEGQAAWCGANVWNSRRTDVPPSDPNTVPKPGGKYLYVVREETLQAQEDTRKWLESIVAQ